MKVAVVEDRHDRAEDFLLHHFAVFARIFNNSWADKSGLFFYGSTIKDFTSMFIIDQFG